MAHILAHNGLSEGGGGYCVMTVTFLESSRQADVKLQLIYNTATYRFQDIRTQMAKISDLGNPWGHCSQKERKPIRDQDVSSCKISRRSVPPWQRYL